MCAIFSNFQNLAKYIASLTVFGYRRIPLFCSFAMILGTSQAFAPKIDPKNPFYFEGITNTEDDSMILNESNEICLIFDT